MQENEPKFWTILSETPIANFHFGTPKERFASHPDGRMGRFFVLDCNDWVQAIAVTTNNELVLVKQFRIGTLTLNLEMPGGVLGKNEDPVLGALRELQEETGYVGSNAKIIGSCYPNPAIQTNKVYFVLVENCQKHTKTNWDENEELSTHLVPLTQIKSLIKENKLDHAITLTGLFYYNDYLTASSSAINA